MWICCYFSRVKKKNQNKTNVQKQNKVSKKPILSNKQSVLERMIWVEEMQTDHSKI